MAIKFDITNRFSGAVQFTAEIECGEDASYPLKVGLAVKWAVKSGAYLSGADLSGADLSGAKNISNELCTPLMMLLDQPGKIRAYKLVTASGTGPHYPGISYELGREIIADDANTDPSIGCGAGINIASLDWCLREWQSGYRILIVEFEAKDIACIPNGSDGKFRVHRCTVIAEKQLDFVKLGLVREAAPVAA